MTMLRRFFRTATHQAENGRSAPRTDMRAATALNTGNATPAVTAGLDEGQAPSALQSRLAGWARFLTAKRDEAALKTAGSPLLAVGPVFFAAPWMLLGFVALPALWWLMKTVPPKPLKVAFPAIRMLFNLKPQDQEPAKMPLWHRILRLTAAGLIVAGLAQPTLNPQAPLPGNGPVLLVVDNGWASAPNWESRITELNIMIDRADRAGRSVVLLPTAHPEDGGPVRQTGPISPDDARRIVGTLKPYPWPVDRAAAAEALDDFDLPSGTAVVWLSNGLDDAGAQVLSERLRALGSVTVLEDSADRAPRLLVPPQADGSDALTITVRRPSGTGDQTLVLIASDEAGRAVAQAEARFEDGQTETTGVFNLPLELRNQLARVTVEGEPSAGATLLLDERWRRRPVGIVTAASTTAQPLLNEYNYIDQALDPYVDMRHGTVDELLARNLSVMILPDSAALSESERQKIVEWVQNGGTLLRFAGPRLASEQNANDVLLPVPLRPGERNLGGQLAGEDVGRVAPFEQGSPFYGIRAGEGITVQREILPQPTPELDMRTWARLQDGTPLVTGNQLDRGWVVLFHTTANTDWSNLALSGMFVEMLRAVVGHSQGVQTGVDGPDISLPPIKTVDGQGRLTDPAGTVRPLTGEAIRAGSFTPQNPPGFYGTNEARYAHNLASGVPTLSRLPSFESGTLRQTYAEAQRQTDLGGPLLTAAFGLALADLLILLGRGGALPAMRRRKTPIPAPSTT